MLSSAARSVYCSTHRNLCKSIQWFSVVKSHSARQDSIRPKWEQWRYRIVISRPPRDRFQMWVARPTSKRPIWLRSVPPHHQISWRPPSPVLGCPPTALIASRSVCPISRHESPIAGIRWIGSCPSRTLVRRWNLSAFGWWSTCWELEYEYKCVFVLQKILLRHLVSFDWCVMSFYLFWMTLLNAVKTSVNSCA